MESSELISVIVPVYNSEKTLKHCLDSIIDQTYKNIEIIIVNDGSTDNSETICKEYQNKDRRIKYIYQNNSGVSNARNNGIKYSNGQYVSFVDSDDYISPDMIFKMYKALKKEKVDVIRCKAIRLESNNMQTPESLYELENKKITSNEITKNVILHFITDEKTIGSYVWVLLINKEIIMEFNEKLYFMEDTDFFIKLLLNINSIYFLNEALYFYNYNTESISKNKNNSVSNIYGILDAAESIKTFLITKNINIDDILKRFNNNIFNLIFSKMKLYSDNIFKECLNLRRIFKDNRLKSIVNNMSFRHLTLIKKIEYILVRMKLYIVLVFFIKISGIKK